MKHFLIGLDLGTSKLSAVALDAADGKMLAAEQVPNRAGLAPLEPDAAEQDAEALVGAAVHLLRALASRPELSPARPLGLGVTGQMHGVVLADRQGRPLSPLITWQDARGGRICEATGLSWVDEFARRVGAQALETSGCIPASGYGGVTLLRLARESALPKNALALTIHALVVRRLCGRTVLDPTDAAGWGMFDVRDGRNWLPGIAEALGLPPALLPEVEFSSRRAGALTSEIAAAAGLPAGLPVAVALGDNQAAFLGSAPQPSDNLLVNMGTGGQMSVAVAKFILVAGLETRPLVAGQRLLVGASLCAGRAYAILNRFYQQVGRDLFAAPPPPDLYAGMNRLAGSAADDCGGIIARTLFAGSRLDPAARGALEGLTAANFTPANLARAIIRGMVDELAGYYDRARAAGASASYLAGAGNALRNNPVVRQELERRLGLRLHLPPYAEEAAVGAALAGGVAAGAYPDWAAASRYLFG